MEDGIPFKAFLYMEEGSKAEVRRFGVDKIFYGKIKPLLSKLRDVFPKLKAKNFTLAWRDEDEDEVLISSDEEVETMYHQSTDTVLKLVVRCTGPRTDDNIDAAVDPCPRTNPSAIHEGITCDACGRAVIGYRYKCITCDNFDLCVWCENDGKHPEHCVVRVPIPNLSLPLIKATIKKSRRFLKSVASQAHEESKKHERRGYPKNLAEVIELHKKKDPRTYCKSNWVSIFGSYLEEFTNLAGDASRLNKKKEEAPEPFLNEPTVEAPKTENKIPTSEEISMNLWNLPEEDLEKLHHACKFMRENAFDATVKPLTTAFSKILAIVATTAEEAHALSPARISSPVRAMTLPGTNLAGSVFTGLQSLVETPEMAKKKASTPKIITDALNIVQQTLEDCCDAPIFEPTAKSEAPKAKKQSSKAKPVGASAPKAKKETPKVKQVASTSKQEAPKAKQEASTSKQEEPKAKQEAPMAKQEAPMANQEAPMAKQEAPMAKQEAPLANQEASTSEQAQLNSNAVRMLPPDYSVLSLQNIADYMDAVNAVREMASNASSSSSGNSSTKGEDWTVIDAPNDDDKDVPTKTDEAPTNVIDMPIPEGTQAAMRDFAPIYPALNAATAAIAGKYYALYTLEEDGTLKATNPSDVSFILPMPQWPILDPNAKQDASATPMPKTDAKPMTQPKETKNEPAKANASEKRVYDHEINRSELAPHILAAVRQMENMGFSNESGWLTQLLYHEDGNISTVLDLITPNIPR